MLHKGQKVTIKDANGETVKGIVTKAIGGKYERFVLETKDGWELDCNNRNCTIESQSNQFYFCTATENTIEVNMKNGKVRILDENNNNSVHARFQKIKEDNDGFDYITSSGQKEIIESYAWQPIAKPA